MMRHALQLLVVVWALVSIGLGILAFAVVHGTHGANVGAAAYEAFETIPEAVMVTMGFDGPPLLVVVAYWLALTAAVFLAYKPR